jgi:hypothetical protein
MAPGSQEASFLTVEEEAVPTTSVSKKSFSSTLNRAGTPDEGSSSEFESEEFPASRDQLKARVYSLLREKAYVPFASPPRIQKTSTFKTLCGLSQELSSSYKSFPESKHVSTVLVVTLLENFLFLVPLLFQAGLEVRISRYTIRLLESHFLLVIKLWFSF